MHSCVVCLTNLLIARVRGLLNSLSIYGSPATFNRGKALTRKKLHSYDRFFEEIVDTISQMITRCIKVHIFLLSFINEYDTEEIYISSYHLMYCISYFSFHCASCHIVSLQTFPSRMAICDQNDVSTSKLFSRLEVQETRGETGNSEKVSRVSRKTVSLWNSHTKEQWDGSLDCQLRGCSRRPYNRNFDQDKERRQWMEKYK